MKLNKKLIKGIVVASSATAIAFLSYKAYKKYKELNTGIIEGEELEIELEARRILREHEAKVIDHEEEVVEEPVIEIFEEDDDDLYVDPEDMIEEGVEELRFPPNSEEALRQYKEMSLAEFDAMASAKQMLWKLFDYPFNPSGLQDSAIVDYVADERAEFFGQDSIHTRNISITDLILHYAKLLTFDLDGGGIEHWANQLLYNMDIRLGMGEVTLDRTIENLLDHTLVTPHGFGMFGLSDDEYARLMERNQDGTMTFTKQYHICVESELECEAEEF